MSENLQNAILTNYWQCLENGAILPLPGQTLLKVSGSDAFRFLNGQITNDLKKLTSLSSLYSAVVTPKGKLSASIYLNSFDGKNFYLNADPALKENLLARLEKYIIADDVLIEDVSTQFSLIHAWGKVSEVLPSPFFKVQTNRIGFHGFDFYYQTLPDLTSHLQCEREASEIFRIEAGFPKWGAELNETVLPPEVGFEERWISYQKGCYTGQEIISRLKSVGQVSRKLMGLDLGKHSVLPNQEVLIENQIVGHITSATYSPRLEKGIALAYIRRQSAQDGTKAYVEKNEVTLVKLPLIP